MFWRAVIAFLVLPGVVAFAVPAIWLWSRGSWTPVHPEGLVLLGVGFAGLIWCVRDFYVRGRGTLAPWAPPKELVVVGLYRFSRNPMSQFFDAQCPHISGESMFDHVKFCVSDFAASKAFFLKALEPLGLAVGSEGAPTYGVELCTKAQASLCLYQTDEKPAHLHLAFTAENREQVDAFYRAALDAGGKDHGAPGLRPKYHANYYAAFVIGPDGHNIEVVCHESEASLVERHADAAATR